MKILIIIIVSYLVLLWNFTATYTNGESKYKVKYSGLLWVILDYWSIIRYHSDDKPMKWIDVTRLNITDNKTNETK